MPESVDAIYHFKPQLMQGDTLYPLHQLEHIYPQIHATALEKYAWRRSLLKTQVPRLNCLWNDVLHFSTIHPHDVFRELNAAGVSGLRSHVFYEIPLAAIRHLPHALYDCPPPELDSKAYSSNEQAPPHEVAAERIYLPGEYDRTYPVFPDKTREYFRFAVAHGIRPLMFYGLPHFLIQAPVSVKNVRLIDWSELPG